MEEFEIGYRRPPKKTQFRKGASGNPAGRPKGSKNFATLLEQELNATVSLSEGGRRKSVTKLQAMVKRLVAGGLQGDQKALISLIEVLRRTGQFTTQAAPESLLPDDFRERLAAHKQKKQKSA